MKIYEELFTETINLYKKKAHEMELLNKYNTYPPKVEII